MWICRVDFNDAQGDLMEVVHPGGTAQAEPGESVVLIDGERNRCFGRIESADGDLATVRMRLATWAEPEDLGITMDPPVRDVKLTIEVNYSPLGVFVDKGTRTGQDSNPVPA
jgi:hypothetical protein